MLDRLAGDSREDRPWTLQVLDGGGEESQNGTLETDRDGTKTPRFGFGTMCGTRVGPGGRAVRAEQNKKNSGRLEPHVRYEL